MTDQFTDDEINALADWFRDLSMVEVFLLKELYDLYMHSQIKSGGHYVH